MKLPIVSEYPLMPKLQACQECPCDESIQLMSLSTSRSRTGTTLHTVNHRMSVSALRRTQNKHYMDIRVPYDASHHLLKLAHSCQKPFNRVCEYIGCGAVHPPYAPADSRRSHLPLISLSLDLTFHQSHLPPTISPFPDGLIFPRSDFHLLPAINTLSTAEVLHGRRHV